MDADSKPSKPKPVPAPKPTKLKSNSMKDTSRVAASASTSVVPPTDTPKCISPTSPGSEEVQLQETSSAPPIPSGHPILTTRQAADVNPTDWPQAEKSEASPHLARKAGTAILLQNFIDTKELPVQGDIETGLYASIRERSIFGERLTFHFRLRQQVLSASFDCGGTYQIPLCSANRFSLLYNPTDNFAQAMQGWYFETVGQIVSHSDPPAAVYATKSYQGPNAEASVQAGDVLFISPRIKSKAFKRGKFLKCIKAGTNEKKVLHESCPGGFNTSPHKLQLSLVDLTSCRYCDLPLAVVMFHEIPGLHNYPQTKLLKKHWEESIIVTHSLSADSPFKPSKISANAIIKDVAVSVLPVKLDKIEYSNLSQETCMFFDNFSVDQVEQYFFTEDPMWPQFEFVQASLYKNVQADLWQQTHQLIRPDKAFRTMKRQRSLADIRIPQSDQDLTNNPMYTTKPAGSYSTVELPHRSHSNYQHLNPISIEEIEENSPYVPVMFAGSNPSAAPIRPDEITDMAEGIGQVLHEVNTANRQLLIQLEIVKG